MVETVSPDWVLGRALKMSGDLRGPWRTTRHPVALEPLMNFPVTNIPFLSRFSSTVTVWISYVAVEKGILKMICSCEMSY